MLRQDRTQGEYIINGTVQGIEDGSKIQLYNIMTQEDKPFDSVRVKDRKFQLKGKLDDPTYVYFKIIHPETSLAPSDRILADHFYIENANITFNADAATMRSLYEENGKRKSIPEIPHLKKIKNQFSKFNIISISIDEMNWSQRNKAEGFEGQVISKYNIRRIPARFIMDKDSCIFPQRRTGQIPI